MATQAAQYPNRYAAPQKKEAAHDKLAGMKFNERLDPKFIKFADGEFFAGVLVGIARKMISGKPACQYTAEDLDSGERVCFNGTYQIDSKLSPRDVGRIIQIRCEGEDPNVGKGGNHMKLFRVFVSEGMAPGWANDGTPITDDDIPL